MKCPWCRSEDLTRSYRTDFEEFLRFIWPRSPFRCRECGKRSWHVESPFNNRRLRWAWGTVTLVAGLFLAVLWLAYAPEVRVTSLAEEDTPASSSTPAQHLASRGGAGTDASTGVTRERPADAGISAENTLPPPSNVSQTQEPETVAEMPQGAGSPAPSPAVPEQEILDEWATDTSSGTATEAPAPPSVPEPSSNSTASAPIPAMPQEENIAGSEESGDDATRPLIFPIGEGGGDDLAGDQGAATVEPPNPLATITDGADAPANAIAESSGDTVREIREIKASHEQGRLQISLLADGPITDYRSFFLSGPPRLVIDLAGEWKRFSGSRLKEAGETVKGIRIGRHPDRLRIVMDLKTDQVQRPKFVESQEGLTITLTGQ